RTREPGVAASERHSAHGVSFFRPGGARPPTQVMVAYIDQHKDRFGVEPICAVLPIAPSTYHEQKAREREPELRPQRAKRDDALKPEVQRVWDECSGTADHRAKATSSLAHWVSLTFRRPPDTLAPSAWRGCGDGEEQQTRYGGPHDHQSPRRARPEQPRDRTIARRA